MEEHSVVKSARWLRLAGKFSSPISHMTDAEVNKPVRRRPPRSLQLPAGNDAGQGQDEKGAETVSTRKNRNSALIEKLQASLTLSPTGPPSFSKGPGVLKLPVPSISPGSPSSPSSPPATLPPKQEETPASFESPTEGTVLKSINKGRARLSIKRRPPSRRHRKSSADEGGDDVDKTASATLDQTTPNGHEGDVFEQHKTAPDAESLSSKEQIEQETEPTDSEKPEPEEKVEIVTSEKKEGEEIEEKEEKTEPELKEEKSEDEPQLANSTEETNEELDTQPQTEPDTTDEKEEEQKKDEVNH